MSSRIEALLSYQSQFFANRPALGFPARLFFVMAFLLISVWAGNQAMLILAVAGCFMFRWLCCRTLDGMLQELRGAVFFSLLVVLLASPTRSGDLLALGWQTFLRFFVFLSPSLTFSRCLYPREGVYHLHRRLPASLVLSIEIALRFLPLLVREAFEVFSIQRCRGAFRHGSLLSRLQAFIFPFFFRLFRMADRVAFSLHSREISPDKARVIVSPDAVRDALSRIRDQQSRNPS